MANGKNALLNLLGKVDASHQLVVVVQAKSGSAGPASALGAKQCAVDASNRLIVAFNS